MSGAARRGVARVCDRFSRDPVGRVAGSRSEDHELSHERNGQQEFTLQPLTRYPARLLGIAVRGAKRLLGRDRHAFLRRVSGVIHVGANSGQERDLYARHDLDVVWIEPIPEVFLQLERNLATYPRQRAFQYLVTDKDNEQYTFHIASNNGGSSSILDMRLHKRIWPQVHYERSIQLHSITLDSFVKRQNLDLDKYDALIMDTQGSELLVLTGAASLLNRFKYIKTEVPDFESYSGCPTVRDIEGFLSAHGFRECSRKQFASMDGVGAYYDIIYRRLQRPL